MRLIVLAAGRGERLFPLTANTPKPLLDLGNGCTLIEEQLHRVQKSNVVNEVIFIIGYLAAQIETKLATFSTEGIQVFSEYNPFFDVSNNLLTLWIARHWMSEDFLITNGDNLFAPEVIQNFVECTTEGIWLAVCPKETFDEDDMKVLVDQGNVIQVSKKAPADKATAESPGLALIRGDRARKLFVAQLESLVRQKVHRNSFWLEVFNELYKRGVPVHSWEFDGSTTWQEVDFHMDLQLAKEMVKRSLGKDEERPDELNSRT